MNKKDQPYFIGAGIAIVLWLILYYVMVSENWTKRDEAMARATSTLKAIGEKQAPKDGSRALARANEVLGLEGKRQADLMAQLQKIEFAQSMPGFMHSDIKGGEDPKNYFDKKRRESTDAAKGKGIKFAAGFEDLGFRNAVIDETVAVELNLARMFIVNQVLSMVANAQAAQVTAIHYPKPFLIPLPEDPNIEKEEKVVAAPTSSRTGVAPKKGPKEEVVEALPPPLLGQIPVVIRLKIEEGKIVTLLQDMQKPSAEGHGFLSVRGFEVMLRDSNSGLVDVEIALGAVFPDPKLKEWKIDLEEKKNGVQRLTRPVYNTDR